MNQERGWSSSSGLVQFPASFLLLVSECTSLGGGARLLLCAGWTWGSGVSGYGVRSDSVRTPSF